MTKIVYVVRTSEFIYNIYTDKKAAVHDATIVLEQDSWWIEEFDLIMEKMI